MDQCVVRSLLDRVRTHGNLRLFCKGGFWLIFALAVILSDSFKFASAQEYLLGADDVIKITVFQQPDLSITDRITKSGTINFPLVGEIPVAGLSTSGAEALIADRLRVGGFVKKPQVSISVETFRSQNVSVLGEVKKPGKYAIEGSSSVVDLLALAGGTTETAHDRLTVIKTENGASKRYEVDLLQLYLGDLKHNLSVSDGDFITVPRMQVFYIYGEVARPNQYRLDRDMTVMQALAVAGGLTQRATQRGIEISRRVGGGGALQTKPAGLEDVVQANDVIFVKESLF